MARHVRTPVLGIVASLRGPLPAVPPSVLQAAWRHGVDLRAVDIGVLRNLIPSALIGASRAWMILYSELDDTDLLLVPYPTPELKEIANEAWEAALQTDRVFECIRPDRNATWTVAAGYRSLVAAEGRGRLPPAVNHFQAIRLPQQLRQLFSGAIPGGSNRISESWATAIGGWLDEASGRIAFQRRLLGETLAHSTGTAYDEVARETFDAFVLDEATCIAERAQEEHLVTPPLLLSLMRVGDPLNGLDAESKRFLATALIVEEVGVQHQGDGFDFVAAACPLCKIVERELNLSVGWLVRILRNVASRESPLVARDDVSAEQRVEIPTDPPPGRTVDINSRTPAGGKSLKGLMLGSLQHLLLSGDRNGLKQEILEQPLGDEWTRDTIEQFLFSSSRRSRTSMRKAIDALLALRNPHVHDTAMSRTDYDKIKKTILGPFDAPSNSLVARIISLKAAISSFAAGETSHED